MSADIKIFIAYELLYKGNQCETFKQTYKYSYNELLASFHSKVFNHQIVEADTNK